MKRASIYCSGFFLLLVFCILIFWKVRQSREESRIREAKHFCELLVPEVESAKRRDGKYPKIVDPSWLEGKQIPELIRPTDFYDSRGDVYRFHFRYTSDFWDNVWAYQCGPQQSCDWENYDENLAMIRYDVELRSKRGRQRPCRRSRSRLRMRWIDQARF
jgi:hypothetical protein